MRLEQIKEIANAVLYEGYLLYPYRHSAIKNRQRWSIGVVYPKEYSEAQGGTEPWTMQTQCLIQGNADTSITVHIRFLHLLLRSEIPDEAAHISTPTETARRVDWSLAGYLANEPWEEGIEREFTVSDLAPDDLVAQPRIMTIDCPGGRMVEHPAAESGATIVREHWPLAGRAVIAAKNVNEGTYRLSIQIENRTTGIDEAAAGYSTMLRRSFISTHTILRVQQGSFVSLLEPPEELQAAVEGCRNLHTWPVLVGDEGDHDAMLSSPIILYDYPQLAPESPGALFDGTEIDEILTLRIMTLTDEEKQEMRQGDERAREILERTEALTPEAFMKMHGTIRGLRPVDEGSEA
jgi:hypothetical protein